MSEKTLIVLVEDEDHLAKGLIFNLEAEGFRVHHEADGSSALNYLLDTPEEIGAVLLDVMLPGLDGFEIVRALRDAENYVPVLMLTARSRPEDVLEGFSAGADDYLNKPFQLAILMARLTGLLRRMRWQQAAAKAPDDEIEDIYTFGAGKVIRFDALELEVSGKITRLTLMEAELMRYLVEREGKIVSRKEILEEVWRVREDTDTRAIDNFIVRLRRYLEDDPARPTHLLTARGVGYRFVGNADSVPVQQ